MLVHIERENDYGVKDWVCGCVCVSEKNREKIVSYERAKEEK